MATTPEGKFTKLGAIATVIGVFVAVVGILGCSGGRSSPVAVSGVTPAQFILTFRSMYFRFEWYDLQ